MTTFIIRPSCLSGSIVIPPSKSHTLRAILFALMAHGTSIIHNYLKSPDTTAMIQAVEALGAQVLCHPDRLEIVGTGGNLRPPSTTINAGNSGQVLRFMTTLAALSAHPFTITGDHSIQYRRPMRPLLQALEQLGVITNESPFQIQGPIKGNHTSLSGEDSQPVSALLMMSAFLDQKTTICVSDPGEKPWIDLTLFWLKKMGCHVKHRNYEYYEVEGGIRYPGFDVTIPGDWSSAAYPLAAALITGSEITLKNVDHADVQGDKRLVEIIEQMGGIVEKEPNILHVKRGNALKGLKVDLNDCIDMVTILPVIACYADTPTEITGAKIARFKESDRLKMIAQELNKMGGKVEEKEDGLIIFPAQLQGASVESHSDHRMTLALSVAGMRASHVTVINGSEAICKSYSTFKEDMIRLGVCIC